MSDITRRRFLRHTLTGAAALTAASAAIGTGSARAEEEPASKPAPKEKEGLDPPNPNNQLSISLIQIDSEGDDREANLKKAEKYYRWAAERKSDIALIPEMFSIGYNGFHEISEEAKRKWQKLAVPRDGEWVQHFAKLAKELKMAIGITYLEEWAGAPRNSLTLFDRNGGEVFTYAKMHTCDFAAFEAATTPGDRVHVADLDTAKGTICTGAMICYDREFPESGRLNMLQGAEVVLVPNACLLDDLRIAQFQVRAHENSMVMAMANYPEPKPYMNGRSVVFDVAGNNLQEAPGEAGIYTALVDMDAMRNYRKTTIWGDAFRRPHRYHALTEYYDLPVFDRDNGFGEPFDPRSR